DDSVPAGAPATADADDEGATHEERAVAREIAALLKEGKKVEAVKRYRAATGSDLVDAVEAINKIQEKHGIKSKGCIGGALLLALMLLIPGIGGWSVSRAGDQADSAKQPAAAPLRIHVLSGSKEYRSE